MSAVIKAILLGLVIIYFTGCASHKVKEASGEKPDAEQIARTKVYLSEAEWVEPAQGTDGEKCVAPADSARVAPVIKPSDKTAWRILVKRANACVVNKDWSSLERIANAIARGDVDSPWSAYFLSIAALETGEIARAMWMIDLAGKKTDGTVAVFVYQRGRIFVKSGQVNRAIEELERALQLSPNFIDAHLFLASVFAKDFEDEKAVQHYKAVLALSPKNSVALAGLEVLQGPSQKEIQGKKDERSPAENVPASSPAVKESKK